jgi:hypothetical protein
MRTRDNTPRRREGTTAAYGPTSEVLGLVNPGPSGAERDDAQSPVTSVSGGDRNVGLGISTIAVAGAAGVTWRAPSPGALVITHPGELPPRPQVGRLWHRLHHRDQATGWPTAR